MIRFVLLFLLLPFFVAAQIPKAKPNTYVNDYTGWLSEVQVQVLNEQILHLEKTTSVQLAVLLINRLPVKMEIEEYAREVGNQWKVGKNFRGLVYVAAVDDRRHRLEVGHNLEGDIPDITALAILDSAKPYLIQQEYYEAVHHLVDAIQEKLAPDSTTIESYLDQVPIIPDPENFTTVPERSSIEYRKEVARYNRLWNVVVWFLLAGAAAFCYWANRYRKKFIRDNTVDGVFIAPDSYYLSNGYHSDSSGSSSGFGGFGGSDGGGFSGGGASDSW